MSPVEIGAISVGLIVVLVYMGVYIPVALGLVSFGTVWFISGKSILAFNFLKVAVGDGALGFLKALTQIWPQTKQQHCWVHKTANVLNKLPKAMQSKVKEALHDIWQAEIRKDAYDAFDNCLQRFEAKHPKAMDGL